MGIMDFKKQVTWMQGEFGGEWIHVYVWPSTAHLKLS